MTAAPPAEQALVFQCESQELVGILHEGSAGAPRGVLIVVGGPQYRVGSHRQFVLLARQLAQAGVPVLRFDHRGFGDSPGPAADFENIGPDIAAAIDVFLNKLPDLQEVVIWGLCDAASAALFYGHQDRRVCGLVLANPWARTEAGIAESYVRRYYVRRLLSRQLWRDVMGGRLRIRDSIASFFTMLSTAFTARLPAVRRTPPESGELPAGPAGELPQRMLDGLQRFDGEVLFILSGDDLTAGEFKDCVRRSRAWRRTMADAKIERRDLAEANHTFSRRDWRDTVGKWTIEWLQSL